MGKISLVRDQTEKFQVDFKALWLIPDRYTIVIFVLPSLFSQISDSLSEFYKIALLVQGSRKYGGGYVYLEQDWSLQESSSNNERN